MTALRKHLAAHSELVACAFLLRDGFEVFRNISDRGQADLVAWKDGKLWPVDVKSGSGGAARLKPEQRRAGVVSLCVDEDGHCTFDPVQEELRSRPPKLNSLLKAADVIALCNDAASKGALQ